MNKQVGFCVPICLFVCILICGFSPDAAWAQEKKSVPIEQEHVLLDGLLEQFLSARDLCEESIFNEPAIEQCTKEQKEKRKEVEQKLQAIAWSSPNTLDWVFEWSTKKGRVTVNDLPDLTLITNEENTLSFLRKVLPGTDSSALEKDPNLKDIVLKLLASWRRNQLPKSEKFLTELRDFLYSKYEDQLLLNGPGLMLQFAGWFGDVRALNRAETTVNNFLKKKSWFRQFFHSRSYTAKQQFRHSAWAIKEFTSSDPELQKRATDLLQNILKNSNTPETIQKSLQ